MKKTILTTALAAVFVAGVSLAGMTACKNDEYFVYDNAGRYTMGAANVSGNVTDLDIDWLCGSVNVAYADVETVTFSETSDKSLMTETTVHYWLENTTLHIKYGKSGIKLTNAETPNKDLTVLLPTSLTLDELEIESVEADITLTDLRLNDVEISNVAGDLNATFVSLKDFALSAVSGNATMRFETAPLEGEYSNVHGDLTMYLPENTGFTLEVHKLNGAFNSEFDTVKQGDSYVCGNGVNEYEFETVSGSVTLKKLS